MKLALICNYRLIPERIGGMDQFFWKFDEAIKSAGHHVVWYFPNHANHGNYNQMEIKALDGVNPENLFLSHLEKENHSFDFIICHFIECCTSFFKDLKAKLPKVRCIAVDHNPRPNGGYPLLKRLKKKIKGIYYSRYIDQFIGVSQDTVNQLIFDFGKQIQHKTKVIYNGVLTDHIQVRTGNSNQYPKFLVTSHLRQSKGIQDLIMAVARIDSQLTTNLFIDVYGDGPYRETLEAMVNNHHLSSHFNFKGNSADLGNIYHQYDYLIHPSHMECMSMSLLESLAANVPVITTTVGGSPELVKSEINGFLFEAGDIAALKQILESILNGKNSIQARTEDNIRLNFSIDKMLQGYLGLLQ